MKKSGFSLAEVLITMAIIAISASLLVPTYMNVKPDKYKLKVLNCYKALNKVTEDLISNPDLYFRTPIPDPIPSDDWYETTHIYINGTNILNPDTVYGCNGLACMQKPNTCEPSNHPLHEFCNNRYQRPQKYPNLLMDFMQLNNVTYCQLYCNSSQNSAHGTSSNQIEWRIRSNYNNHTPISEVGYIVTIDVNPRNNNSTSPTDNCPYSNECQHPDQFIFNVDSGGDITGGDPLTQQYLRNMTNIEKQVDYSAVQGG